MKRYWILILLLGSMVSAQETFKFSKSEYTTLLGKARQGHLDSQVKLGLAYQYGNGVEVDLQTAEYWLKTAGGFGNPQAATQLGLLYLQPGWRESHADQAMQWFLRAAASNYASAEINLALMYMRGWGTQPNQEEALRWLRKAAQHGSQRAKTYLGIVLVKSPDKTQQEEGFKLIQESAKKKDPEALNALGYCYELGLGTTINLAEAMRWYKRGAAAGNADAMHNVASLYVTGDGVPKDPKQVLHWSMRACDAGDPRSCASVASAYALGEGAEKNSGLAYQYGLIAKLDQRFLDFVKPGLSEEDMKKAASEAERWQSDHVFRLSALPQ